jgi:hypothetical protein
MVVALLLALGSCWGPQGTTAIRAVWVERPCNEFDVAVANDPDPPRPQPEFPHILGVTVFGKAMDLYTTADCIQRGCIEVNKLQPTPEHRYALGAATSVLVAVGCYELEKRDRRFRWVKWGYLALHVGFAINNEVQAHKR